MFYTYNWQEIIKTFKVIDHIQFNINRKKDRKSVGHETVAKAVSKYRIRNTDGEFNRAMGNAVKHGSAPVKGSIYVGQNGEFLVVLTDSGKGFDYQSVINKCMSGQKYFNNHGKGFRKYSSNKNCKVCWSDGGRTISLLYNK